MFAIFFQPLFRVGKKRMGKKGEKLLGSTNIIDPRQTNQPTNQLTNQLTNQTTQNIKLKKKKSAAVEDHKHIPRPSFFALDFLVGLVLGLGSCDVRRFQNFYCCKFSAPEPLPNQGWYFANTLRTSVTFLFGCWCAIIHHTPKRLEIAHRGRTFIASWSLVLDDV